MSRRLEELARAETLLTALLGATVAIANNSTASELMVATNRHEPETVADLESRAVLALAHCKAAIEVEDRRVHPADFCGCGTRLGATGAPCRQCGRLVEPGRAA